MRKCAKYLLMTVEGYRSRLLKDVQEAVFLFSLLLSSSLRADGISTRRDTK